MCNIKRAPSARQREFISDQLVNNSCRAPPKPKCNDAAAAAADATDAAAATAAAAVTCRINVVRAFVVHDGHIVYFGASASVIYAAYYESILWPVVCPRTRARACTAEKFAPRRLNYGTMPFQGQPSRASSQRSAHVCARVRVFAGVRPGPRSGSGVPCVRACKVPLRMKIRVTRVMRTRDLWGLFSAAIFAA